MSERMTLAKALRHKKRIIEKIRKLEMDIQLNNSKIEGEEREVDVLLAMRQRAAHVDYLMKLKMAVQEKTRPIQSLILEIAEAKTEIAFLQRVDTTNGVSKNRFQDNTTRFEAVLRKSDIDKSIANLQTKIDDLQTKIDTYNAETVIEISGPDLP